MSEQNNLPNGYKMTELGPLPEEWQVVRLGEVIFIDREKLPWTRYRGDVPIIDKIPFETGTIVFRKKQTIRTDLHISGQQARLVTSKINFHQGAVALITHKSAATTHYEFYALRNNVDADYLWRYLRTEEFKKIFAQEIKFRGFKKEANYKFIQNILIPLPPLPEQRAIAHVLRTVQKAKETTERVIAALRELKKSLMRHLFTFGPVPVGNVGATDRSPLKETEIGPIPEHWQVVRLEEVVMRAFGGGTPSTNNPNFWVDQYLGLHLRQFRKTMLNYANFSEQ